MSTMPYIPVPRHAADNLEDHPAWCDRVRCSSSDSPADVTHRARPTAWATEDHMQVSVGRLMYGDTVFPRVAVKLDDLDTDALPVETHLNVDDAERLANALWSSVNAIRAQVRDELGGAR